MSTNHFETDDEFMVRNGSDSDFLDTDTESEHELE